MEVLTLLRKAEELGLKLSPDGESLSVKGPCTPEVLAFLPELKAHKPDLLAYLERRRRAEEAAADIEKSGWGVYWCDLFGEPVAFIWDDSFRAKVLAGIVVYTRAEIETLWAEDGPSNEQLLLIHQAKKIAGARVIDFTKGGDNG